MSVSPLWPRDVTIGEIRGRDMSQWCTTISSTRQNLAGGKSSAFGSFHFEWLYDPLLWLYIWLLIIEGVDHDDLPLASPADRPPTNQTEGGQKVWSVTIPIQVVSHHRRLPYLSSTIHCLHYCVHQIFTLFFWITSPGLCDDLESFSWRVVGYLPVGQISHIFLTTETQKNMWKRVDHQAKVIFISVNNINTLRKTPLKVHWSCQLPTMSRPCTRHWCSW